MNIQLFTLLLNLVSIFSINAEPLVKISQGTLNGTVEETRYGRKYSAFLGIPYAKPPIGNLRFANPEPAEAWSGIRSANSLGNYCPQFDNNAVLGKEDCLYLNVYTPFSNFESPVATDKLLPVMVWIHGGSYLIGGSNMYGAGYLLQKDVILVTINYRLGILGFLTTSDSLASGNFGMKDQVLALKWIQKNIKSFGGDPNKVTLFGESAGGIIVNLHAISKASDGLFQKYIIQSGTVLGPGAYRDRKDIDVNVKELAKSLRCPVNTSQAIIDCLRKVNSDKLAKESSGVATILKYGYFLWVPTIEPDTEGAFLTEIPKVNNNQMKDLPFMSGTMTEEGLSFTSPSYSNYFVYVIFKYNVRKIISYIARTYNQESEKFFSAINKFYFDNWFYLKFGDDFLNRLTKFFSDSAFLYPQIKLLEKATPNMKNKNYFYSFGYRGELSLTTLTGDKRNHGASHGDDIFYLFPITYGSTIITRNSNFTRNDEKISKIVVDFWTSFATNGAPTSNELGDPNLWQPFSVNTSAHIQIGNITNNKDPSLTMSNNYFKERMNFWRKNFPL